MDAEFNLNLRNRCCAVVNTHSSYHDVLSVFLKSFSRYVADIDLYVFSNESFDNFGNPKIKFVRYSSGNFRDQYLECLRQIPYEYLLTFNDDYFLTGTPRYSEISRCINVLDESEYSHIRFVRGPNFVLPQKFLNLYPMNNRQPYFFSQTLSLWRRVDLLKIFEAVAPSGIARKRREPQFEVLANSACEQLGLSGLVYYENEKKVGSAHYECNLVPHIVSAIVDGYWNTKEYSKELSDTERDLELQLNPSRYPGIIRNFVKRFFT